MRLLCHVEQYTAQAGDSGQAGVHTVSCCSCQSQNVVIFVLCFSWLLFGSAEVYNTVCALVKFLLMLLCWYLGIIKVFFEPFSAPKDWFFYVYFMSSHCGQWIGLHDNRIENCIYKCFING